MKIRVIPTILTDGLTVVKGEKFNNWRTVGSAEAIARLYASRNVDELLFLDVNARARKSLISIELLSRFSNALDIPFTVGGGISTLEHARACFRSGAEKVVLGTSAILNPSLISEVADVFGSQAIVVSIDLGEMPGRVFYNSGKSFQVIDPLEYALMCQKLGAGEILLQNKDTDGCMGGYDINAIRSMANVLDIPVIASSGAGKPLDFLDAVSAGASAVAAGAIFQFTENTPKKVSKYLRENNVLVRNTGYENEII
jgi:cyclase